MAMLCFGEAWRVLLRSLDAEDGFILPSVNAAFFVVQTMLFSDFWRRLGGTDDGRRVGQCMTASS